MPISLKQISALEKVQLRTSFNHREINSYSVLQGQRLSYQITIVPSGIWDKKEKVWVESELADYVRLYCVKDVVVDKPNRENVTNENYLLTEPGTLPDLLVPLEKQNNYVTIFDAPVVIWVKIDIPASCKPGKYSVKFCVNTPFDEKPVNSCEMEVTVLPAQLPEQNVKYTRWFYADCIADIHNAEIFSERHWKLIEEYIKVATDEGINMILVPTHTPPLDTAVGTTRPCVQLIDIEKKGDTYIFGFEKFRRFIAICKKHGVKYYEMAHLFSQWYMFAVGIVCSEFVNFLISLVVLVAVMIVTGAPFYLSLIYAPIVFAFVLVLTMGVGLILATATTFFTDIKYLYGVLIMLLSFMTPLFYPIEIIPEQFLFFFKINPLYAGVSCFRDIVLYGVFPQTKFLLYLIVTSIIALLIGIYVFYKYQDDFVLNI